MEKETNTSPEKTGGSKVIAYAKVGLWGGDLAGIIDTEKKHYALKTIGSGIKVDEIKFGEGEETLLKSNPILAKLVPAGTTAKIGFEYQGNTLGKDQDDSYIRAFIDIEASEAQLKNTKIGDAPFPITLKKLAVGYLKYGKDSEVTGDDFRQWLDIEKKEVAAIEPAK